jgi:16S rRNA (cytidine1402-2'-O)-methyltransferase
MSGILYLVATPIGNLEDITLRAIRVLREVDFVICEDSRRSGMLLKHLDIKKPLRTLHDHTQKSGLEALVLEIKNGAQAALVSDAGTPIISDPGFPLVRELVRLGVKIEAIPGPCAFVSALIVSGLPANEFTFIGYLPQKETARRNRLQEFAGEKRTLIFYESPYRLLKALKDMAEILGDREASVSREMTKKFEETTRGKLSEILSYFESKKVLGEFAIVVKGNE